MMYVSVSIAFLLSLLTVAMTMLLYSLNYHHKRGFPEVQSAVEKKEDKKEAGVARKGNLIEPYELNKLLGYDFIQEVRMKGGVVVSTESVDGEGSTAVGAGAVAAKAKSIVEDNRNKVDENIDRFFEEEDSEPDYKKWHERRLEQDLPYDDAEYSEMLSQSSEPHYEEIDEDRISPGRRMDINEKMFEMLTLSRDDYERQIEIASSTRLSEKDEDGIRMAGDFS